MVEHEKSYDEEDMRDFIDCYLKEMKAGKELFTVGSFETIILLSLVLIAAFDKAIGEGLVSVINNFTPSILCEEKATTL